MRIECWSITGNGFHFGQHGLGQEKTSLTMPSDSLFAALVARLVALEGKQAVERFTAPFCSGDPPFVLSSTFPFAGQVRFFPPPVRSGQGGSSATSAKQLKKVKFVSEDLFRQLLAGAALVELYPAAAALQNGAVLVSQAELTKLPPAIRQQGKPVWANEIRPRVTLGRAAQNSTAFATGRVSYAPGCGMWFGVRWLRSEAGLPELLATVLRELGDAGLGAERNAGFGACQIEPAGELELPQATGKPWLNLSRYLPRPDELSALKDPRAAYTLVNVGGWLDSPVLRGQRRRPVNLITAGSVLGPLERQAPGQVVDVRPSYAADPDPLKHPVLRCGLALAVGIEGCEP